jgi:hypothetical protein
MKTTITLLLVLLLTGSLAFAQPQPRPSLRPPAPANQGASGQATLVCRMGGNMVWSVITMFNAVSTQLGGKNVRVPVINALFAQLVFERYSAAVPPGGAGLPAGRCGWTDRAMTPTEPNQVVENLDSFQIQETVMWGNGSTLKGETTLSGGHLDFQNNAVFSMVVTRPAAGQFQVVSGTTPALGTGK